MSSPDVDTDRHHRLPRLIAGKPSPEPNAVWIPELDGLIAASGLKGAYVARRICTPTAPYGIDEALVSLWRRGKRPVPRMYLDELARILNTTFIVVGDRAVTQSGAPEPTPEPEPIPDPEPLPEGSSNAGTTGQRVDAAAGVQPPAAAPATSDKLSDSPVRRPKLLLGFNGEPMCPGPGAPGRPRR